MARQSEPAADRDTALLNFAPHGQLTGMTSTKQADTTTTQDGTVESVIATALAPHAVPPHLLSLIALASHSAMLLADAEQRIIFANNGFTRLLGYTEAEVLGQRLLQVLAGRDTDASLLDQLTRQAPTPGGRHNELLVYNREGRPLWVSGMVNPVFAPDGRLLHLVYVLSDITLAKIHETLQFKVLDAMLREQSLGEVLSLVCREIESIAPDLVATVLDVDVGGRGLRSLAAPSLPLTFADTLEHLPLSPVHLRQCYAERVVIARVGGDSRAEASAPAPLSFRAVQPPRSVQSVQSALGVGLSPEPGFEADRREGSAVRRSGAVRRKPGPAAEFSPVPNIDPEQPDEPYLSLLETLDMQSCWIRPIEA
ncbi:MAG: hypothetical protein JWQ88_1292, partial [Rhodoferax sp.]|nr:hypothetical protein [Rhodoferax sp.]